jgi:hypothetical protein
MSEFDGHAADIWSEVESVFGDQATWRSEAHQDVQLVLVADSDYETIETRGGEALVVVKAQLADLGRRPAPNDLIEVQSGRLAGHYEFFSIVEDDGYSISVALKAI